MKLLRVSRFFFLAIHLLCASPLLYCFCKANAAETVFSDIFKPLKPLHLYNLVDKASDEQKRELDSYFAVLEKYNLQLGEEKRVISYSLFWKAPHLEWGNTVISREAIHEVDPNRLQGKSFYERYLSPLLQSIENVPTIYPGWVVRIYLAQDLAFLIEAFFVTVQIPLLRRGI